MQTRRPRKAALDQPSRPEALSATWALRHKYLQVVVTNGLQNGQAKAYVPMAYLIFVAVS
jgi:hypothetical protein